MWNRNTNEPYLAFRDRGAGSSRNQAKSTDEVPREGARGGSGARVRGGKFPMHCSSRMP